MRIEVEFNRSSNNLPTFVEEESETKNDSKKKAYNATKARIYKKVNK